MGQEESKKYTNAINKNWQPVKADPHSLFTNVNPFAHRTLRNELTNEEVEEYMLQFSSEEEYKHYLQELRIRMQPSNQQIIRQTNTQCYFNLSPYIYTVKYFVNDSMQDMCSTIYKGLLYAHKVDLRLKEINDVPLSDQLYLIKSTLQGFKLLYEKVGYFDIIEQMIFIDKLGRVKVWINPNLSLNHPFHVPKNTFKELNGSQSDMIVKLLDLIEQNTDNQHPETIHFRQFLIKKCIFDRLSFYRALQEFQAYCMQERLLVDESMRSIYQLYHQELNNDMDKSEVQELSMNGGHATHLQQKQIQIRNIHHEANNSALSNPNQLTIHQEPIRKEYRQLSSSKVSRQSEQQNQIVYRSYHQKNETQLRNGQIQKNRTVETPQFRSAVPTLHWRVPSSEQNIHSGQIIQMIPPQNIFIPDRHIRINDQSSRMGSEFGIKSGRKISVERNQEQLWNDHSNHAAIRFNYVNQSGSSNKQIQPHRPAVIVKPPPEVRNHLPPRVPIIQQQNRSILLQQFHTPPVIIPQPSYPVKQPFKNEHPQSNLTSIRNHANFVTLNTLNSQNNDSSPNLEELNLQKSSQGHSIISYYSSNQIYTLDKEIADDLQKFLGYSQT